MIIINDAEPLDFIKIAGDLRDEINNGYVLEHYANKDGRDLWSKICSCVDWIDVYSKVINSWDFSQKDDPNLISFDYFSYINIIDVTHNAVIELFRVFNSNEYLRAFSSNPSFEKTRTMNVKFLKRRDLVDSSDIKYFKTMRAILGAHSNNLETNGEGTRFFASWPIPSNDRKSDLYIPIWSSKVADDDYLQFHLIRSELDNFLCNCYECIERLSRVMRREKEDNKKRMQEVKIGFAKNNLADIDLLVEEIYDRFSPFSREHYWADKLLEMKKIVSIEKNVDEKYRDIHKELKDHFLDYYNEIYHLTQITSDNDADLSLYIDADYISSTSIATQQSGYFYTKANYIFTGVYDGFHESIFEKWLVKVSSVLDIENLSNYEGDKLEGLFNFYHYVLKVKGIKIDYHS